MKFKLNLHLSKIAKIFILFISLINLKSTYLIAEESYLNEIEIDSSTKLETSSSDLPTNPFEIVEMLRRANSMNDATKPSDAIDNALKTFSKIEEKENL
tara:strand:+ start:131 stop:427 length:297 start_codon:yes stop_codon:yes gene_type:complete